MLRSVVFLCVATLPRGKWKKRMNYGLAELPKARKDRFRLVGR